MNQRLRKVGQRISESDSVVLHTGPGLLAETELPAVDLADRVWGSPAGQFTIDRSETAPESLWADWQAFWASAPVDPTAVSPLPVHDRIVELVEQEYVSTVVTENVFGLLSDAGVPADRLVEFHGHVDEARCTSCARTYDVSPVGTTGNRRCPACGRTLAPGIVLAGEPPARADRLRAWSWADGCDLYIAVGTRLTVHPTSENAQHAVKTGADLVVIASRSTAFDDAAEYRLSADPASALGRLRDVLTILG